MAGWAGVDEAAAPESEQRGLSYIPALDGLRAVAIVVIMGYHGGVFATSGGFYSIDTFFALSGFLITSLLLSEWQKTGGVRLRNFWARRARRLLPGLMLMLLGVALYAAFVVPPGTYPTLRADSLSSLFYFANWHFIADGSNYFNVTGPTSPLIHMWSLAVEEQFYLTWPLIVLGVLHFTRSRRVLLAVCLAGALASALEMALLYSLADRNRVYYGTDTRAQALLVGAALAVGLSLWADRRRGGGDQGWTVRSVAGRRLALAVGLAGAAGSVVLWTTVSYNDPFAFRGGFLLAALATAGVLFSVVSSQGSVLARCLSVAPVRYVGRISYGMYLWHYPLFTYVDASRTGLTGYPLFGVRSAATLAVATVSYYAVERPIRQGKLPKGWFIRLLTPAAVTATAVALLAATAVPSVAARAPLPTVPKNLAVGHGPAVKVLLVGDSVALTLGIGLSFHDGAYGIDLTDGGILGCGVTSGAQSQLQGVDMPMVTQCSGLATEKQWPQIWRAQIATIHPNVVMVLAGRWEVANRTYRGHWTNIENPVYAAYVRRQLEHAVQVAASGGAHVVLLTAPCFNTGEQPDGANWPEDSPARLSTYNNLVRQVAASSADTTLLDLNALACPGGHYEAYSGGYLVRRSDGVHFTDAGGILLAQKIWPLIVELGHQQMALTHSG